MARILLIDDEADLRALLAIFLHHAGHTVLEAENGAVGLARYASHPVDIVITDIGMPGQGGLETIALLQSAAPIPKIICISGAVPGQAFFKDAIACGANATLAKPFTRDSLLTVVQSVL